MHNYNYFRDYNPITGRYLTWDPVLMVSADKKIPYLLKFILKDPLRFNLYLYGKANPIIQTDPMGLACGPDILDYLFPDSLFMGSLFSAGYSFMGACENHDNCYGCPGAAAGTSKQTCDDNFLKDMHSVCANVSPFYPNLKNHCDGSAWIYYWAVSTKGQYWFDKGREKCQCKK